MLYSQRIDADIVGMGNSRGVNSFYVPEVEKATGRNCINLSYNGMAAHENLALLEDLLKFNQPPRLILLEVSCLSQVPDPDKLKPYWSFSKRLSEDAWSTNKNEYVACQMFHLYRYNTEMAHRILYYCFADDRKTINAQTISSRAIDVERASVAKPVSLELPTHKNTAAIVELIELANANGIPIHLYLAPYLPDYRNRIDNLEEWIAEFRKFSGDTPFWDLSSSIVEPTHFADRIHTNLNASPALVAQMELLGMLRRGDDEKLQSFRGK